MRGARYSAGQVVSAVITDIGKTTKFIVAAVFLIAGVLFAELAKPSTLFDHFLPDACSTSNQPTLIIADVTRTGEIDDSVTLLMYKELEMRGCIRVIGLVSIFGNGRSSTEQTHANILVRLDQLGMKEWKEGLLRGPDKSSFGSMTRQDRVRLTKIADRINDYHEVVVAELGPFTVSARLLMHDMVKPTAIKRILGVGGRLEGEQFSTGKKGGFLFGFRDMNIAADTNAISYLLRHHPSRLWLVTYRTGVGAREVSAETIAVHAPALSDHAKKRARTMTQLLGYKGIPSWDTWTTSYFLMGGEKALGCKVTSAIMRHTAQGFRDPMQLWLDRPAGAGRRITACHHTQK